MNLRQRSIVLVLVLLNVLIIGIVWLVVADEYISLQFPGMPEVTVAGESLNPENAGSDQPPQAPLALNVVPGAVVGNNVMIRPLDGLPGWTYYENANEGYGIGVPPNWQALDLDPNKLNSTLEAIRKKNPGVAADLEAQGKNLMSAGFKLFAYDVSTALPAQPFLTNMNLITDPLTEPLSLDQYVQGSLKQLHKLKTLSEPVGNRSLQLNAGPAVELNYRLLVVNARGEPLMINSMQYIWLRGQNAYILTLTTTDSQAAGYAETFQKAAENVFWLNP